MPTKKAKAKTKFDDEPIDLDVDPFLVSDDASSNSNVVTMNALDGGITNDQPLSADQSSSTELEAQEQGGVSLGGVALTLPDDKAGLKEYIIFHTNMAVLSAARTGYALIKYKEQCEHGEFQKLLEDVGLNPRTSRERMQLARVLMNQSSEVQEKLTKFTPSGVLQLAKFEPEVLEEIAESGEIDELSELNHKALRARVREEQYKREIADCKALEKDDEIRKLRTRVSQWPEGVMHVREEAALASLAINKQFDDLESLLNYMESGDFVGGLSQGNPQQLSTEQDAALGALYQTIAAGLQRGHRLLNEYRARGAKEFQLESFIPALDDQELARVGSMWNVEEALANKEKADAKIKRTNDARKGKRGRPVGSKKGS